MKTTCSGLRVLIGSDFWFERSLHWPVNFMTGFDSCACGQQSFSWMVIDHSSTTQSWQKLAPIIIFGWIFWIRMNNISIRNGIGSKGIRNLISVFGCYYEFWHKIKPKTRLNLVYNDKKMPNFFPISLQNDITHHGPHLLMLLSCGASSPSSVVVLGYGM